MRLLVSSFLIIFFFFEDTSHGSFDKTKQYLTNDLEIDVSSKDYFVVISVDMCTSCFFQHIETVSHLSRSVGLVLVGNSMKKIKSKADKINRKNLHIVYDYKGIGFLKDICSVEYFTLFSLDGKKNIRVPYDNFNILLNEVKN